MTLAGYNAFTFELRKHKQMGAAIILDRERLTWFLLGYKLGELCIVADADCKGFQLVPMEWWPKDDPQGVRPYVQ